MPPRRSSGRQTRSSLDHHRRRLHDGGRRRTRLQTELLDGVTRDDGDDARRLGDEDLDLCEQAVDLYLADGAMEAIARAHLVRAVVAAQPSDLRGAHHAAVRRVAPGADSPVAVPPPQGVEADPERLRGLPGGIGVLRHTTILYLG